MLPIKTGGTEHYRIASDDERNKREAFMRAETLIEVRAMELEAQEIVMEQQQAFKYEQPVTETRAYVAMERQQRYMEQQLEKHTRDCLLYTSDAADE